MKVAKMLCVAWISLGLISCNKSVSLTPQEETVVSELTSNLKPYCVGRYLIDMPDHTSAFGDAKVRGVALTSVEMTKDQYRHELDERSKELRSSKSVFGYKFLYADGEAKGRDTHYFISLGGTSDPSDGRRVIEAYKWDGGYRIKLQIEGSDWTNSVYKDEPLYKNSPNKTDMPEKVSRVFKLLEFVRGRADDDIPIVSGVCFSGGFLPGSASDEESISSEFFLKGMQDVSFDLQTDAWIQESTSLLERGADIENMLKDREGGRTIRKGRVNLPELKAEEWLTAGATSLDIPGHFLTLEANSKTGSAQTPLVVLNMRNGGMPPDMDWDNKPTKASLSESEAIALWDVVSRTLRPRYNGF